MGMTTCLDELQRRRPVLGFPLAVLYKYVDDQGGYLAALIAYYAFLSLFPLLLLSSTILGWVLVGHPALRDQLMNSALSEFPVIGSQLGQPKQTQRRRSGCVIGVLGAVYGGLGVGQALQNAMNTAWAVPENDRPNPLAVRGRSVLLLTTVGAALLGTTVLSAISGGSGAFGAGVKVVVFALSMAVNAGSVHRGIPHRTRQRVDGQASRTGCGDRRARLATAAVIRRRLHRARGEECERHQRGVRVGHRDAGVLLHHRDPGGAVRGDQCGACRAAASAGVVDPVHRQRRPHRRRSRRPTPARRGTAQQGL